jgi:thiol-disulfide isomerase/thioredoxin
MFNLEKKWLLLITLLVIIYFFNCTKEFTLDVFSNSENKTSNLIKVYNFNTSWCGYSVRFQPEWDKFEKEINSIDNLSIQAFDIKCDNINNKQICNDYEISGFPTIIIEKDGKKINYNGVRTTEAIIETIQNL